MTSFGNFGTLVGFELKKIFCKRSAIIAILCSLAFAIAYPTYFSIREDTMTTVEHARALSGRTLDADLILEASEAYQSFDAGITDYQNTPEYQEIALPYRPVWLSINGVYGGSSSFGAQELQELTPEEAESFYDLRTAMAQDYIDSLDVSQTTKDTLIAMNATIETPFVMDNFEGYSIFLTAIFMTGIITFLLLAYLISPIFSNEYLTRVDSLILTSKNGKRAQILAKLLVVLGITVVLSVGMIAVTYALCGWQYGFDAVHSAIQLMSPISPLPLTFGEFALLLWIGGLLGSFAFSGIGVFLSAKLKSPFAVLALLSLNFFGGMINVSALNGRLGSLTNLIFPLNGYNSQSLSTLQFYELLGNSIPVYVMLPLVYGVAGLLLYALAYRSFRYHQVA